MPQEKSAKKYSEDEIVVPVTFRQRGMYFVVLKETAVYPLISCSLGFPIVSVFKD